MTHTELHLAQVERRVLAVERCVSRQQEVLRHRIESQLPTDEPLQQLVDFQVTLTELQRSRIQLRNAIAAARTQRLLDTLCSSVPRTRKASQH